MIHHNKNKIGEKCKLIKKYMIQFVKHIFKAMHTNVLMSSFIIWFSILSPFGILELKNVKISCYGI